MKHHRPSVHLSAVWALASLLLVSLAGCGGAGGTAGSNSSLSITASSTTIVYGDSVTVRWSSAGITSLDLDHTNVSRLDSLVSGSIVDRPASDTTYIVSGEGSDSVAHTKSVTVHVTPTTKKVWMVADLSIAGMPQVEEELQKLTSTPVQTSISWPSAASPADVVMLFESGSFGEAQKSDVQSYLASGGRIIFVGGAPSKLATGDSSSNDLSSIGSWFAGATSATGNAFTGVNAPVVSSNPGVPLSATLYGRQTEITKGISPIAGSATLLTDLDSSNRAGFFAYVPPSGGRVGALGDYGGGATEADLTLNGLTAALVRWAADGA